MNKDIHILFGLRIKELRVRAHISQEELSFRSGLSKNYISDVDKKYFLKSYFKISRWFESRSEGII